jgi:methylamine dehydrogenase accessory protein MauD
MNWSTLVYLSFFVLWIVVFVQLFLTLSLARLVGQLSRRFPPSGALLVDPGPDIGEVLTGNWDATQLNGEPFQISFPRARDLFFFYISPHCTACSQLMPAARRFFQEISGQADTVIVMVHGSREVQCEYLKGQGVATFPALPEEHLPLAWRVGGAPFAVWVGRNGVIKAKGLINLREHLESLWRAANTEVPVVPASRVELNSETASVAANGLPQENVVFSR